MLYKKLLQTEGEEITEWPPINVEIFRCMCPQTTIKFPLKEESIAVRRLLPVMRPIESMNFIPDLKGGWCKITMIG